MISELLLHPQTLSAFNHFADRPTHGLLLVGGAGLGKSRLAKHLAATRLGLTPEELQTYPYFRTISPQKGSIGIEAIRTLLDFFKLKAGAGKGLKRFVLIDSADQLTLEAQNALLKLLEEPPTDSVIMLVAEHLDQILPTVRSRLQKISVIAPGTDAVVEHFESLGFEKSVIERAWLLADGSLAAATDLLKNQLPPSDTMGEVKTVLAADTFGRLLAVNRLAKNRDTAKEFVHSLAQIADASSSKAATTGSGGLRKWYGVLGAATVAEQALQKNANPKLVLTELMLAL